MRLKSFTAPTIHEAMLLVRRELGDEAIIVSTQTRPSGRGVRITAAIEQSTQHQTASEEDTAYTPAYIKKPAKTIDPLDLIATRLQFHGLPQRLIEEILSRAEKKSYSYSTQAPEHLLTQILNRVMVFSPITPELSPQPIMLVGPPGTGKTVTLAKLAARAKMNQRPVIFVTMDHVRAGAIGQLEAFARLLKTELYVLQKPEELIEFIQNKPFDVPTLIDMPGLDPFDHQGMQDLKHLVEESGVEPLLVASAGTDGEELLEITKSFAEIGVERMLATRVDIARRLGSLVYACLGGDLAMSEFGTTPHIVEGLTPINPRFLARLLILDQRERLSNFNEIHEETTLFDEKITI